MPTIRITVADLPNGSVVVHSDIADTQPARTLSRAERFAVETLSLACHSGFSVAAIPNDQSASAQGLSS